MPELPLYVLWLPTLLLVMARVAGMVLVGPIFAHAAVPMKLRIFVAVVLGFAVVGRMGGPLPAPPVWADLVGRVFIELLIGATIGFAARLILAGVELGAFHVGQQMGVSLADVFNPISLPSSGVIRRLFGIIAIAVFLAIGAHRVLIQALLETFDTMPMTVLPPPSAILTMVVGLLGASFSLALRIAAAVLITMLLASVAMGLLQKTIPQWGLLSVGLPIRTLVSLAVLAISLAALAPLMEDSVRLTIEQLSVVATAAE